VDEAYFAYFKSAVPTAQDEAVAASHTARPVVATTAPAASQCLRLLLQNIGFVITEASSKLNAHVSTDLDVEMRAISVDSGRMNTNTNNMVPATLSTSTVPLPLNSEMLAYPVYINNSLHWRKEICRLSPFEA
jgi:hypothetical protein